MNHVCNNNEGRRPHDDRHRYHVGDIIYRRDHRMYVVVTRTFTDSAGYGGTCLGDPTGFWAPGEALVIHSTLDQYDPNPVPWERVPDVYRARLMAKRLENVKS